MSLADIHSSLLAKDRANSPIAAEMLRQHYDLPALAELNKRFVDKILKAVSQELVFLGIRTVETIRWLKKMYVWSLEQGCFRAMTHTSTRTLNADNWDWGFAENKY